MAIKHKKKLKYRELAEFLMESPRICEALELREFPDFTTSCKQFVKFERKVLIILIYLSACLLPRSGKAGIDATCYDRRHNPRRNSRNSLFNEDDLHQRSKCETVNSMTKRNYGDTLTAKGFYNQLKEALFIAVFILRISTEPDYQFLRVKLRIYIYCI